MKNERFRKGRNATMVCILIGLVYIILMKLSGAITHLLFGGGSKLLEATIREGLYVVWAVALMKLTGNSLFRRKKRKGARPFPMYLLIAIAAICIIRCIIAVKSCSGLEPRPVPDIIMFTLYMLFVGIAEECIFRGIIAESLIRTLGSDEKGRCCAMFISGMLFGLMHLINLMHSDVVGVLCQVFGCFVAGIFFAELYYKYHSLWAMIFIHATMDFAGLAKYGFYGVETPVDIISSYGPALLIPYMIILALWIVYSIVCIKIKESNRTGKEFYIN